MSDGTRHWPVEPFDACEYEGATPPPWERDVAPLSELPDEHAFDIAILVQAPTPPPKWILVGFCQMESRAWLEWHWYRGLYPRRGRSARRGIRGVKRRQVIERDGQVCGICRQSVPDGQIEIDHIIPVSQGGSDDLDNLQVAHVLCNRRKGARV